MMLIGNNCVSAAIYRALNILFNMPFCWCCIDHKNFMSLIKKYDKSKLKNIDASLELYKPDWKSKTVLLNIKDMNIDIHFIHHAYDINAILPHDDGMAVHYNDILSWSAQKWVDRYNRMNEEPVFLYAFNTLDPTNSKYAKQFKQLLLVKKPLIIVMHESIDISTYKIPDNIKIIKVNNDDMNKHVFTLGFIIKDKIKKCLYNL